MVILGLLLALAGATLIFVGQRMFWIRQLARRRGCVLESQILKWERIRIRGAMETSGPKRKFQPFVSLIDPLGVQRTALVSYQHTRQYKEAHPKGSMYPVLFDPMHPDRILDTSWTTGYFLPALLTLSGSIVLILGLCIVFGA